MQIGEAGQSVVFRPDSLIRDSLRYEYTKIRKFASKHRWSRELYKMLFVTGRMRNIDVFETQNSEMRFVPHQGKTIREISFTILPPFGTHILDTAYDGKSLDVFRTLANVIHQRSSRRALLKQMTLEPGDRIIPFEIVENELLLKELSSVDDALIFVREIPGDSERVDLVVVCKDEFSWTGSGSSNFSSSGSIGIQSNNMFRLGHTVSYQSIYRRKERQAWGNIVEYRIPNLFSTHIDFYGSYENTYKNDLFTLQLDRPFRTFQMRWAGGVNISRVYSSNTLIDKDVVQPVALFNYLMADFWGGHSFPLKQRYSFSQNIYLTARYTATRFKHRPEVTQDSNHFYYNRDRYMGALSYMKLKYFKGNLIYDFGRTEDIPSGVFGALLLGYEHNEFDRFLYLGAEFRYSWFNIHTERYYMLYAGLGSFLNGQKTESGILRLSGDYFTSLMRLGRYRVRCFHRVDYTRGLRRNPGDCIYFQDSNIHGFESDSLSGDHRFSLSSSATLFLPQMRYGFRTAIAGYLDYGVLGQKNKSLFHSESYWGVGVGLHLRNDNIVFKNIHIRITWYPKTPSDVRAIDTKASSSRSSGFPNFRIQKPEPIRYE